MLKISKRDNPYTKFGIETNLRLMEMNQTQTWLIEEIKKEMPERYIDSSLMSRILTGRVNSPDIISAIGKILDIPETGDTA